MRWPARSLFRRCDAHTSQRTPTAIALAGYPTQLTLPDDRVLSVGGYGSEADPAVPAFEIWDGRVRRVTSIWPEPFLQNLGARPLQLAQATLGPAGPPCLHVRQLRLTPACIGCRLCRIQAMLCLLLPAHMVQAASIFTPRSRCCLGPPMLGATCCLSSRATQG